MACIFPGLENYFLLLYLKMHSTIDVTKLPSDALSLTSGNIIRRSFLYSLIFLQGKTEVIWHKKWDVGQKQEKAELNDTFFSVNSRSFSLGWHFDCQMSLKGSTASRSCHQCWSTGYTYQVCIAGSYYRFTRPLNSSLSVRIHHLNTHIKLKRWLKTLNVEENKTKVLYSDNVETSKDLK